MVLDVAARPEKSSLPTSRSTASLENGNNAVGMHHQQQPTTPALRWIFFRAAPFVATLVIVQQILAPSGIIDDASTTVNLKYAAPSRRSRYHRNTNYTRTHRIRGRKEQPELQRVNLTDLLDLNDDALYVHNTLDHTSNDDDHVRSARQPLLDYLARAGLAPDDDLLALLPRWQDVTQLYGDEVKIIGLDTCAAFRRTQPAGRRYVAVGGQMNVGTNALGKSMHDNIRIRQNHQVLSGGGGMLPQMPWNKHGWVDLRGKYLFQPPTDVSSVLPVILIRDPYYWMHSMCESPYTMTWQAAADGHCPNLLTQRGLDLHLPEEAGAGQPVKILWGRNFWRTWQSLAHVWSEWYREYYDAPFPRLMIRFEDMLFRAPEVMEQIRQCAGAEWLHDEYVFTTRAMKKGEYYEKIKPQSSLLSAMIKNGPDRGGRKTQGMSDLDREYARNFLDPVLMNAFGYGHPE